MKRAFEIDDLFRFSYALEAQLSPDGKRLAYTLMRTSEPKGRQISNLWLMEVESGRATQLTFGDWEDSEPAWSPEGESLAFLSDRTGKPQIYQMLLAGGEARPLTSLPQGVSPPLCWSPNGRQILFSAPPEEPVDLAKPYRLTRPVYRLEGPGYIDAFSHQLFLLELKNGKVSQLTRDGFHHTPLGWSPDGREILEFASLDPETFITSPWLRRLGLDGEMRGLLSNRDWTLVSACWLADGRIAFIGLPADRPNGTRNDLYVMQADGSGIECRTGALAYTIDTSIHDDTPVPWSFRPPLILAAPDSSEALVSVMNGGQINLVQVSLKGPESHKLVCGGERFCFPFSRRAGRVVFGEASLFDPTQLVLLDLDLHLEKPLTRLNRDLLSQIELPACRNLHFPSSDRAMVEGWVLLPAEGKPPYPTILHIHGGPHSICGHSFHFDYLTLTGAGYAVLFINHRGSLGYGDEFATATHAGWGHLDYDDLMAGVDHAVSLGLADPDRLGCCGISGGGSLSCWIVGHTDRFKAAVPENPVTNFVSLYGTGDISPIFLENEFGGKPHEVPEVYARCSPITCAHRCKTPTLLFCAGRDYRCPAEQAEQFYTVLKANGCVVEMIRYPQDTHLAACQGSFAARRVHNEALVEWFDRWVKK